MLLLVKDAVQVADPEARILGDTFREWRSEMWKRKGPKGGKFPRAHLGLIPVRTLGVWGFIL